MCYTPSGTIFGGPNIGITVGGSLLGSPGENVAELGTILPLSYHALRPHVYSRHGPDFHRPQSQITIDSLDFHPQWSQKCLLGGSRHPLLRSAVGMTCGSDLWWAIPFCLLLGQFWDITRIPHDQASPSQTHGCPGVSGSRQSDHVIMPINIGTYHIQPKGVHGLCFGYCFSGPLPLRSLILGPLSRVHFGESLVVSLYSEIDHTYLSIEAQCVSHHYPRWTATSCSCHIIGSMAEHLRQQTCVDSALYRC